MTIDELLTRQQINMLVSVQDRELSKEEIRLLYNSVFPRMATPGRWDIRLQKGKLLPAQAVDEELGQDMRHTYNYLVEEFGFLDAGKRPHNPRMDLPRHLWDTTYRAQLMGLDLETRQIALMHSLLEYKARGLGEAVKYLGKIRSEFGNVVAEGVKDLTFWDAILLDHFMYYARRNGKRTNEGYWDILSKITAIAEKQKIHPMLERAPIPKSKQRLIPVDLSDGDLDYREAKTRLHAQYAHDIYQISRAKLESMYENGQNYDNRLLILAALCSIDKLRTADGRGEVERVTRESLDLLVNIGIMDDLIQNSGILNNALSLVNATLKTELLIELDQRTKEARDRRDTTFATYAEFLAQRLTKARALYGVVGQEMGYKPAPLR